MKKMRALPILFFLSLTACEKKADIVILEKDTPAYQLGKELSSILPIMDPDSNRVFLTTKSFHVSAGEVLDLIKSYMGNNTEFLKNMDEQRLSTFIKETTMQLAEKKLLLKAARKSKIKMSASEIDSMLNLQYRQAGGEEKFIASLNASRIDFEIFKKDMIDRIIIKRYFDGIVEKRSQITEEQIQSAYQEFLRDTSVSVRHILLLTRDMTNEEKNKAHDKMGTILSRARKGEDFAELAREFSEDPGSKENGGLYENFSRGDMVKPFETASFSVPIGEISDIVETQYGYHIIKVIDRTKNDEPLEDVRSELEEKLRGPELRNIIPAHLEGLKKKANLEMMEF